MSTPRCAFCGKVDYDEADSVEGYDTANSRKHIAVEMQPKDMQALKALIDDRGWSQQAVLGRLIRWWMAQPAMVQASLVNSLPTDDRQTRLALRILLDELSEPADVTLIPARLPAPAGSPAPAAPPPAPPQKRR